jgi:hypothetical protein
MTTITVKQFVMLLTSQAIVTTSDRMTPDRAFGRTPYNCGPIVHIICADSTEISVQCHSGCHAVFSDIASAATGCGIYSDTFGKELAACETDCEELDQYGIDDIDDIEAYVAKHGGIDIEATTSKAIECAIKACEKYTSKTL